jgi:hypothetical protein
MGEILDSFWLYYCHYSRSPERTYRQRTENYLNALGDLVDIWEIGNEVNGEWVGWRGAEWEKPSITAADMQRARDTTALEVHAAYELLKGAGCKTAVTFYFNDDGKRHSWSDETKRKDAHNPQQVSFGEHHGMLSWATRYRDFFPEVDYVLVSYYQDDNFASDETGKETPIVPTPSEWAAIFKQLHDLYPQARFGFGEMAPQCHYEPGDNKCEPKPISYTCMNDHNRVRRCKCCLKAQPEYVQRYYLDWDKDIQGELEKAYGRELSNLYLGGYFYWYFNSDVINKFSESKDKTVPKSERDALVREATSTRSALLRAFHNGHWR